MFYIHKYTRVRPNIALYHLYIAVTNSFLIISVLLCTLYIYIYLFVGHDIASLF